MISGSNGTKTPDGALNVRLTFLSPLAYLSPLPIIGGAPTAAATNSAIWQLRYLFEDYALDADLRELHRGQVTVPVPPQVFDLIEYLIRERNRVVSRDELIDAVWSGRIVSEAAITTRLNVARSVLGDSGDEQRLIRTVPRKGFRFVGAVQEMHKPPATSASVRPRDNTAPAASLPRLSIVVLPFANLSGDPEQEHFVDGVTESLTTDLSRISGSFVIGRHTAFTYKGSAFDLKQIGRDLNVRYILEGSVQRRDSRLRVNVQLVDAETAGHLWAERFDKPIVDLFDLQDEIVSRLANTLDSRLTDEEARRSEQSPHPDSMELYFRGKALLNKAGTPEHLARAKSIFEQALALDPQNVEAMVGTAAVDWMGIAAFMSDDRIALLATAEAALAKVLSVAPNHAFAHLVVGGLFISTNRALRGIAECERALELDRNLAEAHAQIGLAKYVTGRGAETEAHINEAFRLSPRDIFAHRWLAMVGMSKLQIAADAEARAWFLRSIESNRNYPLAHFALSAALALLGLPDQANAAARTGLALDPGFTVRRYADGAWTDNPTYLAKRQRVCQGMRLAGIPDC
jgi:TolB-like protein